MVTSLRARLGLLFLGFFLLLSVSVAATFWALDTQKQDALAVNLAGRQRMLVQQMAGDALRFQHDGAQAPVQSLVEAAHAFDETLAALIAGGTTVYPPGRTVAIPATRDPATLDALAQVEATWMEFRGHVAGVAAGPPGSHELEARFRAIEGLAPELLQQADEVVRRYEAAATLKLGRVRAIQAAFFAGSLALLVGGLVLVHRAVVQPLRRLARAAERIGRSDLATPVGVQGPREIERLACSFEAMRADLAAWRQAQQQWTEELESLVAQRTRELAALHEVSREITSQLEIRQVRQSVTDKARTLLAADVAVLCLLEPDERFLQSSASSGPAEAVLGGRTSALHQLAERVLASDEALPCGADECQGCCGILAGPFRASHLVAPLRIGPRVLGALCVGGQTGGQFSGEARHVLTELANSAAIALENARLYAQAERMATLEERQRIAAEMHDGLAQMVSYLGLQADRAADLVAAGRRGAAAEQLQRLRGGIEQASVEVRRAITSLQQDPQPPQALQGRLARLAADLAQEGEPAVDLVLASPEPLILTRDACQEVLRVVGEAVLNARRHAGAGRVGVRLEHSNGEASVTIQDDGRGFDPAAPLAGSQHFGMSIMRARAARLGGSLAVKSGPGQGTRVTLTWPVEGEG